MCFLYQKNYFFLNKNLGVIVQKQDSIVDGQSIKILLKHKETVKDSDGKENEKNSVYLHNLYLKPGKIKCFAMTSLLTLFQKHKTDIIKIEAMGRKTLTDYQPPVTYNYYVQFNYSYGADGFIFWGWLITLSLFLSITFMIRIFRIIAIKKLLSHPKNFLMNIKKKVMEEEIDETVPVDRKASYFGFIEEEKESIKKKIKKKGKKKSK